MLLDPGLMKGFARVLAAALLAASALPRSTSLAEPAGEPALEDLHDVAALESAFNRDAGKVRLILLLSPT